MRAIRRMVAVAVSVGLTLALGGNAMADPSYTYGAFSLMFGRSAGQYWDAAQDWDGQWAWSPQSATVSDIEWGDPATWPPSTYEQFEVSSGWVLMDGYGATAGAWESQVVTRDEIGDANCNNDTNLPSTGKEYYVAWNIPSTAYCLQAWGYIQSNPEVDFYHRQIWSPPAPCSNSYYSGKLCITQTEVWSDNNGDPGGPLTVKQDRSQEIALGVGMAFAIDDVLHGNWRAYDRYYWGW